MISPANIRVNRQKLGNTPRECVVEGSSLVFSWALDTDRPQNGQTACRVMVLGASGEVLLDTGHIETVCQELTCPQNDWPKGVRLTVSVEVWNGCGESGQEKVSYYIGDIDWTAGWVSSDADPGEAAVYLRREFTIDRPLRSATLYACGLGYHELTVNGVRPDDSRLDPACTDYTVLCQYAVLPEMETLLKSGQNCLGVVLASGWRRLTLDTSDSILRKTRFAGQPQLSLMLNLLYEDGTRETIASDEAWTFSSGPITQANVFDGETYDARREIPGWNLPGYTGEVRPVAIMPAPGGQMRPMLIPPIREKAVFAPVSVCSPESGKWIVDFGQNIAGVLRVRIPALPEGTAVTLRHAELLNEDGLLFTEPLREAKAQDTYISDGQPAVWQPAFTYHGFRYAEITGFRPRPGDIEAVQLYTDLDKNSSFRCGSALLNAIQKNIVMTERDNMHSILTDCPQRDERMGWMNDATVRFEETPFNFDTGAMFRKIVRDIRAGQREDGAITCTVPYAWYGECPADPVCTSYLMAAWQNWLHNGDLETIAENFDGFAAWEKALLDRSEGYIVNYSYYGDWAGPAYACEDNDGAKSIVTPGVFMSTGYSYYNCTLLARFARLLGREETAAEYDELAARIRQAMLDKWYDASSCRMATGSQACQAFSLWLGILPKADRETAARLMRDNLVQNDYRFTTGNLCTRYLLDMLAEYGYIDEAYELMTREAYPSFGFMLQQEATTIWERFELKKNPGMNSHNHPMYGAAGSWLYTALAGIRPTGAGFSAVDICPRIPGKLMSAQAVVDTIRGPLSVRWVRRYGGIHLYVDVPAGVTATIRFAGEVRTVSGGFHHLSQELPEA